MKYIIALIVLLTCVGTANAAPIGLAIAAFASTTLGGIVVNAILGIALSVGASLLKNLSAKKTTTKDPGTSLTLAVGGDNAVFFPLGNAATGGVRVYCGTWANPGGTPNEFAVNVIAISCIPIRGLYNIWFKDQKVTVLYGDPKQPQGWPVLEYRQNGVDYAWIDFHDGNQTAYDAYLWSKFSADPNYPWETDMIGRGVSYVTFTARYEKNGLWAGGIPDLLIEVQSIPVYDIRGDSTAGGSGPQRWADPTTWQPSNNNMVLAYNVARGIYYGTEWVYGGQNWPAFRLPASSWIAGMNACDAIVDGETQFRAGAIVQCDVEPAATIEELLKGASGLIAEVGGIYKIRIGAPGAAVFAFTDDHVVITKDQGYSPYPGLANTVNTITITYTEPTEKWANKASPDRSDAALIASDDGRRLPIALALPWVLSNTQAQRVSKAALYNGRRFRRHTQYLPPEAWLLEPLDVVAWSSVHNGYVNKLFDIEQIVGGSNFLQGITIRENDPTDYNWNPSTDKLPYQTVPLVPSFPLPQPMSGWAVLPYTIQDNNGIDRRPGVQVFYAAGLSDIRSVHIQVRLAGATNVQFEGEVPYDKTSTAPSTILTFPFLPNVPYEVRGMLLPYTDRITEWSSWLSVTTPNILLTGLDIYLPGVVPGIIAFVADATSWIRDSTRQQILEAQRLARITADQDMGTYTDRQTLRRELVSVTGSITASYTEEIVAATGPTSAISARVETIEVTIPTLATASSVSLLSASITTVNGLVTAQATAITALSAGTTSGDVSTANFRMTVTAGPAGYGSRIGMEARTGGVSAYRSASLFIDVPTSTGVPTRIAMVADQFSITNGSDIKNPFVFSGGTLYVNDMVVDWAKIVNATIGWANISAAVIGNLVATTANIGDLTVTTLKIAYDQVTTSAQFSYSNATPPNGNISGSAVTIPNLNPAPVKIYYSLSFTMDAATAGAGTTHTVALINTTDSSVLASHTITRGGTTGQLSLFATNLCAFDFRPSGARNQSYVWQISSSVSTAPGNVNLRCVWEVLKR